MLEGTLTSQLPSISSRDIGCSRLSCPLSLVSITRSGWPRKPGRLVSLSRHVSEVVKARLEERLLRTEATNSVRLHRLGFRRGPSSDGLDGVAQRTLTSLICDLGLDVAGAARLIRGETASDPRPNKALDPDRVRWLLLGYEHVDLVVDVITHGIKPRWKHNTPLRTATHRNHQSCQRHLPAVLRSIREGQDAGKFMVVDDDILSQWSDIVISPFGAVEKKNVDPAVEVRLIHDLSFPVGASTNTSFDSASTPEVVFEYVYVIAERIARQVGTGHPVRMLKGDIKGAFRHLMLSSGDVHWMAARIPEAHALIVDLSAPFGWSGSPVFYSIFGRTISWLVQQNSPSTVTDISPDRLDSEPFFGYEWVDDHVMIEPDRDNRLALAEATLRVAMIVILGPYSVFRALK